jgi:hypothetical protein
VRSLTMSKNCLGVACRLRGHRRVPPPPAGMTTAMVSFGRVGSEIVGSEVVGFEDVWVKVGSFENKFLGFRNKISQRVYQIAGIAVNSVSKAQCPNGLLIVPL